MNTKDFNLEIKSFEENEDGGSIVAYASTFDRIPDSYGDIVSPGAFTNSLNKWRISGKPIPFLFGHRTDSPDMNIGAVYDYEEDEHGLKVYAKFDAESATAQYCRKLVKEGRLSKLSFAYAIKEAEWIVLDGRDVRELKELDIFEVSLVPIPANQYAEVIDAKDGDNTTENAAAPVDNEQTPENRKTDPIDAETEEITVEDINDGLSEKLSNLKAAIKQMNEEMQPAFNDLVDRVNTLYDAIAPFTDESKEALTNNSEKQIETEGDSDTETVDVIDGTVDEVEEKGAPDDELLAKISDIFKLGA